MNKRSSKEERFSFIPLFEMMSPQDIFSITSEDQFFNCALNIFKYQFENNPVYRSFCDLLFIHPSDVRTFEEIPFLPIEFFKTHAVHTYNEDPEFYFTSSGTTSSITSKHYISDFSIYKESFERCFNKFYNSPNDYTILALLPNYLERKGSSLVYMVDQLIKSSKNEHSGFYLNNHFALSEKLRILNNQGQKTLLIGVSYALLDLIENQSFNLGNSIIMETGGMKGRRKEMIRAELHEALRKGFGVDTIHSEYGMTELLSQSYSKGNGVYQSPSWKKILVRDTEDPLRMLPNGKTGGLNIIDLANMNSCSFIATKDLGKTFDNGSFTVEGRFDHSDIRGCNLMAL